MLRYEILYLFGGIYVDTDMECRKNFDPLLQTSSFVGMGYPNDGIPNAIMACEKGSEIFECITQVVAESYVRQWDIVNDPKRLYKDADGSMHKISDRFLTKAETIHPVHYFYPFNCIDKQDKRCGNFEESYAIHHWNGMEQQGWARIDYSACKEMAL
jgi:mannosyltransferase OCH1-like enzyme